MDEEVQEPKSDVWQLKQEVKLLTDDNNLLRVRLGNLETRHKREVELTTAYRRVIKDLSEDL